MKSYFYFGADDYKCYINKKNCKDWHNIGRVIANYEWGITNEEYKLYKKEIERLITKHAYDIETRYLKYSHYDTYEETSMYSISDKPEYDFTAFWAIDFDIVDEIGEIIRNIRSKQNDNNIV